MTDFQKSELKNPQGVYRILWLEDMEDDVMLAERELKKAGLKFTSLRVDTREEFSAALPEFKPDLILSDHGLPMFNSIEAFKIYKSQNLSIPFILVTGTVSEEFAVSSLKLGIDDYVLKTNLSRLAPAILNSLHQRQIEKGRREREEDTQKQNERLEEEVRLRTQELINEKETLRLHDERMELAFSSSGNAWWDWDIVSGKVDSHPNRYLTLGYSGEEVTPHADWWMSLIHPADREKVIRDIMECLAGTSAMYDTECRLVSKKGEWMWFHVLGKVVTSGDNGQPLRMIGTADNITKNKLIEQELIEAKYAAESANRTKSQFLANMSHEIRTPLNAVIGLSHLAMKTELTTKQMDYLKKIHTSSESLLGIINDILDFSKIEAGKLTLEEVSFDLEEVLQKLADVITYKAYSKGLEIAFGIGSDVFTHLIGDPIRLEQILSNLCSNAVKFTDKGEVVVMAKLIQESEGSVKLQFEVRDTGIGMDRKQQSKLFMPFTQADDSISRKYGGTGLGLSIIKRLIELMDGTVWVNSKTGEGSTFYFTAWFKKQKLQRKVPVPSVDLRKLSVLIVDDNDSALKILKDALESFSFEVITCNSGIQAVHYLKNNNHRLPIKLVLMDWKMPEMDGLRAAEIIRQDEALAGIKIIMMCTSYANEDLYQKADELGLSGILIKPIRHSMLYDTLMMALDPGVNKKKETQILTQTVSDKPSPAHLLLVEDNEINQQVATELLEGYGYSLEIASNGLEAIAKVKASGAPSKYDLVLMDLQMPVMGGFKATLEIRKMKDYKSLPIIAMTADAMGGVREKCLEVGMMDFVTKPINPSQLLEVLQKWLDPSTTVSPAPPTNERSTTIIPKLDGIDVEDGLSHLNGNTTLYYDLLIKFRDNYHDFIADVKNKFTEGNVATGKRMIHTLKGMAANLGMIRLHELTVKAEETLNSTLGTPVDAVLKPLSFEMKIVLESLRKNLVAQSETSHIVPLKAVGKLLRELTKLLRDQDPEALKVFKKIGTIKGHEKEMEKVGAAIAKYDFDTAVEILEQMGFDSQ